MELCITTEMQRSYSGITYTCHSRWGRGKCWGSWELTSSHKSHLGAGLGTCTSSPWAGPAPGEQWVRLFQTQGGRLGCGPHFIHSERRRDTGSLSFLFFSHLKSYGSLCFYSEGKGAWAQFSAMWMRGQTGSIRRSLLDLSHPWTVERLCWTKTHVPSPAPSQPAKVN